MQCTLFDTDDIVLAEMLRLNLTLSYEFKNGRKTKNKRFRLLYQQTEAWKSFQRK